MLHSMGLVPALPRVDQQRYWALIDDRVVPEGPADGEFATFIQWVNKASSWIGFTGSKCFDARNRPCRMGQDFMRARDEGAFPVRWYSPERFPAPLMPLSASEIRAVEQLRGAPHCFLRASEIRSSTGKRAVPASLLAGLVAKGFIQAHEDGFTMDEHNLAEFAYELARQRRASYCRKH
jgi:hypothetical protein